MTKEEAKEIVKEPAWYVVSTASRVVIYKARDYLEAKWLAKKRIKVRQYKNLYVMSREDYEQYNFDNAELIRYEDVMQNK